MQTLKTHYCRQIWVRNTKSVAVKRFAVLCILLALTVLSAAAPPAISTADPHRYLDDIKALSAPAMEGRGMASAADKASALASMPGAGSIGSAVSPTGWLDSLTLATPSEKQRAISRL